ncbi:MAG: MerC domain-containing protein [Planctomycetota bacterium]
MTSCISTMSASAPLPEGARELWWDRLGIFASVACVVHCLAAPLLLLFLPVLGAWWSHPAAHVVLAALVLPLAGFVVVRGYRKHRRRVALVALVLGCVFILAGLVLPYVDAASGLGISSASAGETEAVPSLLLMEKGQFGAAETGDDGCTETCCPSIAVDAETGQASFNFPPGSIATFLGSVFLVLAHAVNLHGCLCFNRSVAADACGCVEA